MKHCNLFAIGIIVGAVTVSAICADRPKPPPPPMVERDCCCQAKKPKKPKCDNCYYQIYYR